MDPDDMRRHLAGAASTESRGGPGHGGEEMMALSMVSTDLGRLGHRLDALAETVQALGQVQGKYQDLTAQVTKLAEQVTGIGDAVAALKSKEPPAPPPQPWDWASMSEQEEAHATLMLAEWVETTLAPWWPRTVGREGLPPCWIQHPDMLRSVSLLLVSYQQAYEHDQRRVHHEVDFRRCLTDMMRDVGEAAQAYHCRQPRGEKKPHLVTHGVRPERQRAREHLRQRALKWIGEADRTGDQDRITKLMEEYDVSPERLREHMKTQFQRYLKQLRSRDRPGDQTPVIREAGRVLSVYQVVDTDALESAPDLELLLKGLHTVDRDRFRELQVYEPLLRKYAAISEYVEELSGRPTSQTVALMEQYGITDSDVVRVRNTILKLR